jgi:hypothetical protein
MGMLDWFKALAAGKAAEAPAAPAATAAQAGGAPPSAPVEEGEGVVAGLNFKTAIDAHMKWKIRLEQYIQGKSQEDLKVEVISRDDQCPLGKWIHSAGSNRFGHLREFQEMKMEHSRFHLCAGDVLACAVAGDAEGAMQKLRSGDYVRASERVKLHLARLYVQVTDKP